MTIKKGQIYVAVDPNPYPEDGFERWEVTGDPDYSQSDPFVPMTYLVGDHIEQVSEAWNVSDVENELILLEEGNSEG